MRIAVSTESFYPAVDGTTTTVRHVVDRLVDLGHEVLVLAPAPGLPSYRGCRVARIRTFDAAGRVSPGQQVRDALAGFAPDLLLAVSPDGVGRRALKHAGRGGVPTLVIQTAHVPRSAADLWRHRVLARADHVVATCTWVEGRLAEYGAPGVPVWTPGVDPLAFAPTLRGEALRARWGRDDRVVVGYAGSLRKQHGVRRLAELAGLPGVRLVVIGDGPQRGWLERHLPDASFTRALETGDLAVALASLDVLVHPGERETCCHVLREAAASAVPVVAPAAGGAPDAVRHGETGLLYAAPDPLGLTRAVAGLVAEPDAREALAETARTRATERTWEDAVDELLARHVPLALSGPRLAA